MSTGPRLLWLLSTEKGMTVLKELAARNGDVVGLVSSYDDPNASEAYGSQIRKFCDAQDVTFIPWTSLRSDITTPIRELNITGIVAIGWQYLIAEHVWSSLPNKLIVFHDSLLPRYRGFAPLATGMINGETEFGLSVIYAGKGTDDGPIILQERMHLCRDIYAKEAIVRMSELYSRAALRLIEDLRAGSVAGYPQDESKATYSLWRDVEDCAIDWSKPAEAIYNLIRAVGLPHPGAFTHLEGSRVYVWKADVISYDLPFEIRDFGKIWRLEDGWPTVVCGSGLLRLTEITDSNRCSLIPMTRLRSRFR